MHSEKSARSVWPNSVGKCPEPSQDQAPGGRPRMLYSPGISVMLNVQETLYVAVATLLPADVGGLTRLRLANRAGHLGI